MTTKDLDTRPMEDPEGSLETALIEQFLATQGYDACRLSALPGEQQQRLLAEASAYAASRLAEVESRARFIHEIHREN